ncbi:class I mannose-6-phosphate isomerase [Microbacterium sp. MC2]
MKPIVLPANQPRDRFYAGGAAIARFRRDSSALPNTPEDWVASVTTVRGEHTQGLSRLPDGTLLADRVQSDPEFWLGKAHLRAFGADPNLLVKLLDAGQRLPVHAHPDDEFAARHLGAAHGKAEAWYILSPGVIFLGLKEDLSAGELHRLVSTQQISCLLERMHTVPVASGDTVFVPPGVLHAIGDGILLVEVQQPEDLSILLEWRGFNLDGAKDGHLGLGFPAALRAVERCGRSFQDLNALIRRAPGPGPTLVEPATPFFRLDLIEVPSLAVLPAGFGVIVVLEGDVSLRTDSCDIAAVAGSTVLLPAAAGAVTVAGSGRILHCRPPAPEQR